MLKSLCKKSQASPAVEIWKRASTGRREKGKSHSAKLLTDSADLVAAAPDLLLFYLLLFCKYLSNTVVSHHFVAGEGEVSSPQRLLLLLPAPSSGMPPTGPGHPGEGPRLSPRPSLPLRPPSAPTAGRRGPYFPVGIGRQLAES